MKRNKETQYRIKLIQENHYNKIEQRLLDREASLHNLKYKEIYSKSKRGFCFWFMAAISVRRANKAMAQLGIALAECENIIRCFSVASETVEN